MKRVKVNRDKKGFWTHPELPAWDESANISDENKWFAERGLDFETVLMDGELGEQWANGEIDNVSDWEPEINIDGAFLVSIFDTDDGVVALFAFPHIILEESEESAQFKTGLSGWVSSDGRFFGDNEQLARYAGSTHKKCKCGAIVSQRSYCQHCHDQQQKEKYLAMPVVKLDSVTMIYDQNLDRYFDEPCYLFEHYFWEKLDIQEAMPIVCKPNYARQIEDDYWCDELPEDRSFDECGGVDNETIELLNKLNEKLKKTILSYSPGNTRLDLSSLAHKVTEDPA